MSIAGKHAYRFGYLKSEQWDKVRVMVLMRDNGACQICGLVDIHNDVHHVHYPDNVWETQPADCKLLCRKCHQKIHLMMKHGIRVNSKTIELLRNYFNRRREADRKRRAKELEKAKRVPRCFVCGRTDLPVASRDYPRREDDLWCSECWSVAPIMSEFSWKVFREFMKRRRAEVAVRFFSFDH